MTSNIGILGGVFDPVHRGHFQIASNAARFFNLEKIYFVPAGIPPHKSVVYASAKDRLAMLSLALKRQSRFVIWDTEIKRGGVSYTIDTVRLIKKQNPDYIIYLIIGSDNLVEIPSWHKYRQLLKQVILCVCYRPGYDSEIPIQLKEAVIRWFPSPCLPISSTMIRNRIAEGKSCSKFLPRQTLLYIKKHKLYQQKE